MAWENILQTKSVDGESCSASLVVLGDICGRRTLPIPILQERDQVTRQLGDPPGSCDILSFASMDLELGVGDAPVTLGVWTLNDLRFSHTLDAATNSHATSQWHSFVIMLDLDGPDTTLFSSLTGWCEVLKARPRSKERTSQLVDDAAEEKANDWNANTLVLCCRRVGATSPDPDSQLELSRQLRIRKICLEFGIPVFWFPDAKAEERGGLALQNHVLPHLFADQVPNPEIIRVPGVFLSDSFELQAQDGAKLDGPLPGESPALTSVPHENQVDQGIIDSSHEEQTWYSRLQSEQSKRHKSSGASLVSKLGDGDLETTQASTVHAASPSPQQLASAHDFFTSLLNKK